MQISAKRWKLSCFSKTHHHFAPFCTLLNKFRSPSPTVPGTVRSKSASKPVTMGLCHTLTVLSLTFTIGFFYFSPIKVIYKSVSQWHRNSQITDGCWFWGSSIDRCAPAFYDSLCRHSLLKYFYLPLPFYNKNAHRISATGVWLTIIFSVFYWLSFWVLHWRLL